MSRYLSIELDDGSKLLFESSEHELVRSQSEADKIEPVDPHLAKLDTLAKGAAALCASLREHLKPDGISLTIGATLQGKVGWVIAESTASASVSITVSWTTHDAEKPQPV